MLSTFSNLVHQTAFSNLTIGNLIMVLVALILMYLAIAKQYEPLLLLPISFGMMLVNIYPAIMEEGGLLWYFYKLDEWAILPSLIFLGVGALTDFGPLIANPKSFLLGAAAQFGVFGAFFLAMTIGFSAEQAAAVSIIGGADGPTSIFLAMKLGQNELMGPIAVAAYSYMSLVPIIQPPIMRALTTEKERKIKMEQLRPVSKRERIMFPVIVTIVVCCILPSTAPLIGMLMLGNLFRESGVVRQLQETASNALMYIVVILLGTSVGATTSAEAFLNVTTIKIVVIGLIAFAFGSGRRPVRQTDEQAHGRQDQPSDRLSRSIGSPDGCPRLAESRRRVRPDELPADARYGTERCRRHRYSSRSRCIPRDLRSIRLLHAGLRKQSRPSTRGGNSNTYDII